MTFESGMRHIWVLRMNTILMKKAGTFEKRFYRSQIERFSKEVEKR